MPTNVDSKFSLELVQNYFSQLNPIANRIANDIDETKSNYGQLWYTLSANEQNDIINETLIRPELSLRYFDKFSTSSTESSSTSTPSSCGIRAQSSKSASADSLAAVVLKNLSDTLGRSNKNENQKAKISKDKIKTMESVKHFYAYDCRNLRTFALQKVALKIVHDDILGAYRDEHSLPFSYRTKSQMNLHLFTDGNNYDYTSNKAPQRDDEICLLNEFRGSKTADSQDLPKHDKVSIENYKKLQNELKLNLRRDSKEKQNISEHKMQTNVAPYERLDNQKPITHTIVTQPTKVIKTQPIRPQVKPPPAPIASINNTATNEKKSIIVDCKNLESALNKRNQNEPNLKSYLNANTASTSISYAVYSDTFYDHGERTNLMQNFGSSGGGGSGILTASSSSAATSDDDDEKTLCEEVKLLDNDVSLRKGFDFLNNW